MKKGANHSRDEMRAKVRGFWPGAVQWDVSLAEMTTLRTGGSAMAVIKPASIAEAECIVKGCIDSKLPWVCIGGGSNVLARDEGFSGVVISMGREMARIRASLNEEDGKHILEVETGCSLASLLKWCVDHNLSGLEFTAGIPGTVGGAVAMNAGAWGKEMKDVITSVTWFDGETIVTKKRNELQFAYRRWLVAQPALALKVEVALEEGDPEKIKELCRRYVSERKGKQPTGASAGSFFKNQEQGAPAGKLIQDAGLKGARVGGAVVSEVHANFIINSGGATADDIMRLMKEVQEQVVSTSGVRLEPEVHFLGPRGFEQ